MSKKRVVSMLAGLLALCTTSVSHASSCKMLNLDLIKRHLPPHIGKIELIKVYKLSPSICEAIVSYRGNPVPIFYLPKDDILLLGAAFKNGEVLGKEHIEEIQSELIHKKLSEVKPLLEGAVAFRYKPKGRIKGKLYMFTDPLCPFCHRTEKKLVELEKKYGGVELNILFFPVHLPIGKQQAIAAVCMNGWSFKEYMHRDWFERREDSDVKKLVSENQCSLGREKVESSIIIAKKLNVRGVPYMIFEDSTGKVEEIQGADLRRLEAIFKRVNNER
jgi:thiol:disulfide interchange protein DsbC